VSAFTGGANTHDMGSVLGGTDYGAGSPMYDDVLFADAARQSSSGLAVIVVVRRVIGTVAGTPEAGIPNKFTFRDIRVPAYLWTVSPEDVYKSGGFYEYGDLILGFEEFAVRSLDGQIRTGQSETGVEGDRVVFNLHARAPSRPLEYRIVGNVDFNPIGAVQVVRKIICRKLGLAQDFAE